MKEYNIIFFDSMMGANPLDPITSNVPVMIPRVGDLLDLGFRKQPHKVTAVHFQYDQNKKVCDITVYTEPEGLE